MTVTGNDGVGKYLYHQTGYDRDNQVVRQVDPASEANKAVTTQMKYNAFGELVAKGIVSMWNGWSESYSYDNAGHLWRTNAGDGVNKVFLYDLQGHVTADLRSRTQGFGGALTNPSSVAGLSDLTRIDYRYDALGRQITRILPAEDNGTQTAPLVTIYEQGSYGGQSREFWAAGTYNLADLGIGNDTLSSLKVAPGWKVTLYNDANFQTVGPAYTADTPLVSNNDQTSSLIVERAYAAQRPTVNQTFDRWGNLKSSSDPRAATSLTEYRYDANNQVVSVKSPQEVVFGTGNTESSVRPETTFFYDVLGRRIATRDALGHVNTEQYDAAGKLVQEVHADGGKVAHVYDAFGNEVQRFDANQMDKAVAERRATLFGYDKLGQLRQTTRPSPDGVTAGAILRSTYDQAGRVLETFDGENRRTAYDYDLRGNVTKVTLPGNVVTVSTYDQRDRKTSDTSGADSTTWGFDYFGTLTAHRDLGGAVYTYGYDGLRHLLSQTNTRGQDIRNVYTAAGLLRSTTQKVSDSLTNKTTYVYDLGGRRTRETTTQNSELVQDNVLAYNQLGQLTSVEDRQGGQRGTDNSPVGVSFRYDAVGNVRQTNFYNGTSEASTTTRHYAYDQMNRQTLVDGASNTDTDADLVAGGHRVSYDKNGNRVSDRSWSDRPRNTGVLHGSGNWIYEMRSDLFTVFYGYDADNRLNTTQYFDSLMYPVTESRKYDKADRVTEINYGQVYLRTVPGGSTYEFRSLGESGVSRKVNTYTAAGQLNTEEAFDLNNSQKYKMQYSYDAAGNLAGSVQTKGSTTERTDSYGYSKYEGYLKSSMSSGAPNAVTTWSTSSYDVNGYLIGNSKDESVSANSPDFVNNVDGMLLQRRQTIDEAGNAEYGPDWWDRVATQIVANGRVFASTGLGLNLANPNLALGGGVTVPNVVSFDGANLPYQSIDSNKPGNSPGAYRVSAGETLRSIALRCYGDTELWYLIADANGLTGAEPLVAGRMLSLPGTAGTVHNNVETFKPYDPAVLTGASANPVALGDSHCGAQVLSLLVNLVVTAVVTFVVGMALTPFIGPAAWVVGGAAGSFVGSLASQGVLVAMKAQDEIEWNQAYSAAIIGGFTGGAFAYAGGSTAFTSLAMEARMGGGLLLGLGSNAAGQGVSMAVGSQDEFSWNDFAASGVMGALGGAAMGTRSNPQIADKAGAAGSRRISLGRLAAEDARSQQLVEARSMAAEDLRGQQLIERGNMSMEDLRTTQRISANLQRFEQSVTPLDRSRAGYGESSAPMARRASTGSIGRSTWVQFPEGEPWTNAPPRRIQGNAAERRFQVNLAEHEGWTHGLPRMRQYGAGHAEAKHIGIGRRQVFERYKSQGTGSSSFTNERIANGAVNEALHTNRAAIENWLGDRAAGRALELTHTGRSYLGYGVTERGRFFENARSLFVHLVRDPNFEHGFRVNTAYPTPTESTAVRNWSAFFNH